MEGVAPGTGDPPPVPSANALPDAAELRARFDAAPRFTVGIEEEAMVLDPETLELAPHAAALIERLGPGRTYKLELPASQLEITSPVAAAAVDLAAPLQEARERATVAADGLAVLAAAAVHPFSSAVGQLHDFDRYEHTRTEYGAVAARQLVCALHVHVAVGDAATALAVYNAARSYLPQIAALAANGTVYGGCDSGMASVRPKLCELLPRQGVPPAFADWEELAEAYRWGASSGAFLAPRTWWWELRLHPSYGTLEFRVPDAQPRVADAVAVAGVVQALVARLAERHGAGDTLPPAPTWQIEENRWSACRHGLEGSMVELASGRSRPTRQVLAGLLEELAPVARGLGDDRPVRHAAGMLEAGGHPAAQRERLAADGARGVARWLADCFLHRESG